MKLDKIVEHEDKTKRVFVVVVESAEEERRLIDLVYRPAMAVAPVPAKTITKPKAPKEPKTQTTEDHSGRDKPKAYCRCKHCAKLRGT